MISGEYVLDSREFRLLEGLRLNPRKSAPGAVRGERLTRRKGISIEFADYRDYTDGDDLRHLDWNVLARLGTPIIRTYQDEQDLAVHLLLDCSASMDFGTPTKFEQARRLACAIGYIALTGTDAVFPRAIGKREAPLQAMRGRAAYHRLAPWCLACEPTHSGGLGVGLREFAAGSARAGLGVLLTDGLDPDIGAALRVLAGRRHEVALVQILSAEELDPDIEGDLRLLDSESCAAVEVTAHSQTLREYRRRLDEHCEKVREECRRIGGRYLLVRADEPLDAIIGNKLSREGWVTR